MTEGSYADISHRSLLIIGNREGVPETVCKMGQLSIITGGFDTPLKSQD